ncbi:TauD/TfdA family dioxygenase [Pseudonocardia kongjuensis]|uniref:TauD/TfdA family dioxygenase n=1 Tax=Pseudonocardia kongjuensis TaxID=102227 RepID=A0ABN1XU74_9PSEU
MTLAPDRSATTELTVTPVAGHIGADVDGVDLAGPLDPTTVELVTEALHRHKVLFFAGQELDHAAQIRFGRTFGELTYAHPHDEAPPEDHPEIFTVDPERYRQRYDGNGHQKRKKYSYVAGWHTDVTAAVNPPAVSVLRADVVPEFGGDTTWTNLVAAYQGLSEPVRAFVDGLRAEHRYGGSQAPSAAGSDGYAKRVNDNLLVSTHPVVRVHPVTGERALFVNPGFTSHIVDVSARESAAILDLLHHEITRPEYTVRYRWRPGGVAVWDNRATAHLAPADLDHLDVRRTLHRVTVIGDRPVGPDGFTSEIVAGRPFTADHAVVVD